MQTDDEVFVSQEVERSFPELSEARRQQIVELVLKLVEEETRAVRFDHN